MDPAAPFSTLFEELPLLSVVFFAFATEVAAFFKAAGAGAFTGAAFTGATLVGAALIGAAFAGATLTGAALFFSTSVFAFLGGETLFFSTSVLDFLGGDLELDRPAGALVAGLDFWATAGAAFADLGGETDVFDLATAGAEGFLAAWETCFLDSSLTLDSALCSFFSAGFFSTSFFTATFFSDTFLEGCFGGEMLLLPFLEEDTAATVATFGMTLLNLGAALELERGCTDADLLILGALVSTLATLVSTLAAAFWSRLRIWTFGTDLLAARGALAFYSTFLAASLRLGNVTLLCNFLGGDAIFFDDLALSTIVFEAFSALTGDADGFLGSGTLALDWLRLTRRIGEAGFFSGCFAGFAAFIVTDLFTAIVIDFFGDSEILAAADF